MFLTRSQGQHATQFVRHRLIKKNSIQVTLLSRDKRSKLYLETGYYSWYTAYRFYKTFNIRVMIVIVISCVT